MYFKIEMGETSQGSGDLEWQRLEKRDLSRLCGLGHAFLIWLLVTWVCVVQYLKIHQVALL